MRTPLYTVELLLFQPPKTRTSLYTMELPWNEDTSVYSGNERVEPLYSNPLKWGHICNYSGTQPSEMRAPIICPKVSRIESLHYNITMCCINMAYDLSPFAASSSAHIYPSGWWSWQFGNRHCLHYITGAVSSADSAAQGGACLGLSTKGRVHRLSPRYQEKVSSVALSAGRDCQKRVSAHLLCSLSILDTSRTIKVSWLEGGFIEVQESWYPSVHFRVLE